ncbi:MAG: response regulator [Alphaproteobacteria bacterium]|nr:response regulator [Alphaproteobacteria bacterium]MBV9693485.1 response regulator [Alphaproteobacteria bacterium]
MANEADVFVVDDDDAVRDSIVLSLRLAGHKVEAFRSATAFLDAGAAQRRGCLVTDIRMPEMDGLELQEELARRGAKLAVVVITGHGDVPLAVRAMKAGATDFLEKPFAREALLGCVARALDAAPKAASDAETQALRARLNTLTPREREVFARVVAGKQSKVVAYELGTSPRTVEVHRARMMKKMAAANLADLVRMALALGGEFLR